MGELSIWADFGEVPVGPYEVMARLGDRVIARGGGQSDGNKLLIEFHIPETLLMSPLASEPLEVEMCSRGLGHELAWSRPPKSVKVSGQERMNKQQAPTRPEWAPFLAAIDADPENPAPVSVFADWLQERGLIEGDRLRDWLATGKMPERVLLFGYPILFGGKEAWSWSGSAVDGSGPLSASDCWLLVMSGRVRESQMGTLAARRAARTLTANV
jgi:uncharacterized protein (TIGR02996 family)